MQLPQTTIDNYIINEGQILGKGTFGEVLLCHLKTDSEKLYAVKRIRMSDFPTYEQANLNKMISNEICSLQDLIHPHIVSLAHFTTDSDNTVYLILDYCEGGDLRKLIDKGPIPIAKTMRYFKQIVKAMVFANRKKYVHRDIKPANILISRDQVKIADFGLARIVANPTIQAKMTSVGTPLYKAPEVFFNEAYSSNGDVWSAGVMLYEMVLGHLPWVPQGSEFRLQKTIQEEPLNFDKDIDSDLRDLIRKMLKKNKDSRISFEDILEHKAFQKNYEESGSEVDEQHPPKFLDYLKQRGEFLGKVANSIKNKRRAMVLDNDLGNRMWGLIKKCEIIAFERLRQILWGEETDVKEIPRKMRGRTALKPFRTVYENIIRNAQESWQEVLESYESDSKSYNKNILNEDYEMGDGLKRKYNNIMNDFIEIFCDNFDRKENDLKEDEDLDDETLRTLYRLMVVRKFKYLNKKFPFQKDGDENPFAELEAEIDKFDTKSLIRKLIKYRKRFCGEDSGF